MESELLRLLAQIRTTKVQESDSASVAPPVVSLSPLHALKDYEHLLDVDLERYFRHGAVVASPAMQNVLHLCERFAPSRAAVLITGQTGTGKEHVARIVHELSGRPGPCRSVNCGCLTKELLTSLFFGHMRGAFTGAIRDQLGLFEDANGGSIFLDEIGELPIEMQPALLRVLDTESMLSSRKSQPRRRRVSWRRHDSTSRRCRTACFRPRSSCAR